MEWLMRRRLKKLARQVLHEARHARHMRVDVTPAEKIQRLQEAEQALEAALAEAASVDAVEAAMETVAEQAARVMPRRPYPRIRENVEIIVVAICVAMGVRTYFIQPFKIPTGSMQPTLYGITVNPEYQPGWVDKPPFRYVKFILTGRRYVEVKARQSGYLALDQDPRTRKRYILVSDQKPGPGHARRVVPHRYHLGMKMQSDAFRQGEGPVTKGTLLAWGEVVSGDHIFVDKVRYNFSRPERGDIVVFRTDEIDHPGIQKTDHYIKRLAGLPGETLQVVPPHLVADGEPVVGPFPFERLLTQAGYSGYTLPRRDGRSPNPVFMKAETLYTLADDAFLPLGDNTLQSLDGRYFGGVPTRSLIGPAFAIYWPFNSRWGRAR